MSTQSRQSRSGRKLALHFFFALAMAGALQAEPFRNLDFEEPFLGNMEFSLPWGGSHGTVGDLLPGWSLNYQGKPVDSVWYDGAGPYPKPLLNPLGSYPVQGQFSVSFFPVIAGQGPDKGNYVLSQQGVIPADAKSIRFSQYWERFIVKINGEPLTLDYAKTDQQAIGRAYWYNASGDVSKYAGQEVNLSFETWFSGEGDVGGGDPIAFHSLDSIRFSPEAVPEPSTIGLLGLGAGWMWLRGRKR